MIIKILGDGNWHYIEADEVSMHGNLTRKDGKLYKTIEEEDDWKEILVPMSGVKSMGFLTDSNVSDFVLIIVYKRSQDKERDCVKELLIDKSLYSIYFLENGKTIDSIRQK